jgi:hypothetical protein
LIGSCLPAIAVPLEPRFLFDKDNVLFYSAEYEKTFLKHKEVKMIFFEVYGLSSDLDQASVCRDMSEIVEVFKKAGVSGDDLSGCAHASSIHLGLPLIRISRDPKDRNGFKLAAISSRLNEMGYGVQWFAVQNYSAPRKTVKPQPPFV